MDKMDTLNDVGSMLENLNGTSAETLFLVNSTQGMNLKCGVADMVYKHKDIIIQDLIISTILFFIWTIFFFIHKFIGDCFLNIGTWPKW